MMKPIILLSTFLIFITQSLSSQKISFNHLGIAEGLSQNSVTSLAQDSIGRIWIGTRDGLNIYDGSEITIMRPIRNDTSSLPSHFVTKIIPDGNYMWVITKNGISKLNTMNLSFEQFPELTIETIIKYKGKILVGTKNGLQNLNTKTKKLEPISEIQIGEKHVQMLYTDDSGFLWIGTSEGLYIYHPSQKRLKKIFNENTTSVYTDSRKQTWVGTFNNGVFLLDKQFKPLKHFYHQENQHSIVNNIIRDIKEDTQGNIWIGTFLGLSMINGTNHSISNFTNEKEKEKTLSHNSIYSILRDKQGNMWFGTYFGGISYFNPNTDLYVKYPVISKDTEGLSFNIIGEIIKDQKNNLWIATEGGGINYLDRENNVITHYLSNESSSGISHNNVKALAFLNKDTLLIGTHFGGLDMLNVKTGKISTCLKYSNNFSSSSPDIINEIIRYKNVFLLGTKTGIIQFDPKTFEFIPFHIENDRYNLNDKCINCLFDDSFGKLWIGTEDQGLFVFDSINNSVKRYYSSPVNNNSIHNNNIACIYEDHKFRLWIGTYGGGLNQYIRDKDEFINYNMATHSLASDFVLGIRESRYGFLWITTSKSLTRFDVENTRFSNYTHKNGFPLSELNIGALNVTNDGVVFVGGLDGLISFQEEDLLHQQTSFNLILTSLRVNNKNVLPNEKNKILSNDLPFTQSITLRPGQNVFSIKFSTSNYIKTNQNTYRYKLENFDKNWVDAGNQNSVTYTNLSPGEYLFKVQGINGIDDTIIDQKQLHISITPPIYRTWYALVFYVFAIGSIIWWFNRMYRARIKLEEKIKLEKRKKDHIKKVNREKLIFFTNISHEFRTPLTLITGTLESMFISSRIKPEIYKKLKVTYKNAIRLNNLVTELLDFRKIENGMMDLKVSSNKISDFIEEIFNSFIDFANYHEIEYVLNAQIKNEILWFDRSQMQKVFFNIISNAFKFTNKKTGKISIEVIEKLSCFDFIISDNGQGMAPDDTRHIFDRYYQIDKINHKTSGQGSGIGLALSQSIVKKHHGHISVESTEGHGSIFTVSIIKGNKHFKSEEIMKDELHIKAPINFQLPFIEEDEISEEEIVLPENCPTILLTDDDKELRDMLRSLLKANYHILEAEDGNEGIKKAIEHQPDLIISDVMMPNLLGTQMCNILKRNIQTSHIPIILLTAKADIEHQIEGIETGADDYITKPFSTKLLATKVKSILQNRLLIQQRFKQSPGMEVKDISPNTIDQELMELAHQVIEKNLDNSDFDVQLFAKEMGLGRTNLFSKIKGLTGQTPNEFILSTRLKIAAEMLLSVNSNLNISEIAYSVGFSTPRYFSRCFREHFGVSPSNYGKPAIDSVDKSIPLDDK